MLCAFLRVERESIAIDSTERRRILNGRTFTIQILILTLVHSGLLNGASKPHLGDSQFLLRQRIEQFGVGTELKVKLADGTKLRGLVERIGEESFFLAAKDDVPREKYPITNSIS